MSLKALARTRNIGPTGRSRPLLTIFKQFRMTVVIDGWPSIGLIPPPLEVAFTADVTGISPYTFAWSFGDGGSDVIQNPVHTYKIGGTFKVTCQVTDRLQRTASDEMVVTVNVETTPPSSPPPEPGTLVLKASGTPDHGAAPLQVFFKADGSGGVPPLSYQWDFGDGVKSDLQNPSHTYEKSGDYTAGCSVKDSADPSHMVFALVKISVQAPSQPPTQAPLTVEIFYSPASPVAGEATNFESAVHDGSAPYDYSWNFGDGEVSIYQNPVHYFAESGVFRVSLTVKDSENRSGSSYVDLLVSQPA